ncbi:MAG: ribose-phosphate pyrophosphokinase [Anaerolineales bacterium]|uniref:ribose-phosphate diphosphokinase n=1 Tax=Candidatus Villigracilis affinis TaxID=3140682 RepID=UPI002A1B3BDE|nr:ribose-phosphate pyrophosphokinase [Anaerolineales bacterium]MBL0346842.1 ribose-phosphate pyrophosphokinase [Anaerolineales bacterium]
MADSLIPANEVRFFSGSSNPQLAGKIASHLSVPLEDTHISRFSNDNLYIQLGASVRYRRVYIVQSLSKPVNDHLMELLMMIDIARSAAASEVHAIIPYYSFGRSDKKDAPRISITARLVADLLKTAGATHVMSIMFHSPQVHGFFGIPTDPLSSSKVFKEYLSKSDLEGSILVAPDMGQAKTAARFARTLNLPIAAGNKERVSDTQVIINGLVGDQVRGHERALIYDDEIATGGSILELSRVLIREGLKDIRVICTHGVFSNNGLERLAEVPEITEIITTDTVHIAPEKMHPKLTVLSVAPVFANAIRHNINRESLSDLFVYGE